MNKWVTVVALGGLITSPTLASVRTAAMSDSADAKYSQPSLFVGATYRVGFDRQRMKTQAQASLKIAGMQAAPGRSDIKIGEGIALSSDGTGKAAVQLAGWDIGELDRRSNLSTGATIAIGVGAVLLIGAAILVASKPWECRSDGAPCD